jgi:hypothetical protein
LKIKVLGAKKAITGDHSSVLIQAVDRLKVMHFSKTIYQRLEKEGIKYKLKI